MSVIRLSSDVETNAQTVAKAMGLGRGRAAIEAVFRCHWEHYLSGKALKGETPSEPDEQNYQVIRG